MKPRLNRLAFLAWLSATFLIIQAKDVLFNSVPIESAFVLAVIDPLISGLQALFPAAGCDAPRSSYVQLLGVCTASSVIYYMLKITVGLISRDGSDQLVSRPRISLMLSFIVSCAVVGAANRAGVAYKIVEAVSYPQNADMSCFRTPLISFLVSVLSAAIAAAAFDRFFRSSVRKG